MATRAVEAGAAGHGAEPRGKRTDQGEATYLVAIAEALWEEMERDERVFLLGEDIGVYGGAFKVTEGFIERFGPSRVLDTPIVEETIVGAALGAAMEGLRPVAEFQYADFMSSGYDEITTAMARYPYRSGVPVPVVLRGPSGGGVRASSFHSTNPEPWLSQAPGLKVICPAFPSDAKGLLKAAIRDDNPCVFLEHKWIYRRIKEIVSDDPDHLVPIGKADVKREGTDVSVITHGMMVHLALEAAETLANEGIQVEVLDLRTVQPLDVEGILATVQLVLAQPENQPRGRALREPALSGHGRGGRLVDRRGGVRVARCTGRAALAAPRPGAVLSPARGRVPSSGVRHRGRRPQAVRMVNLEAG